MRVCVCVQFMEAELNDNCPAQLYPAIGMRVCGSGTVSVCILDPANWNSPDQHAAAASKHAQVSLSNIRLLLLLIIVIIVIYISDRHYGMH